MKFKTSLIASAAFVMPFLLSAPAGAKEYSSNFDVRHAECLETITTDAQLAYEDAMIWRGDGGGRRAKHCEAMALFAIGHHDEAAHRLNTLAKAADGGTDNMRADYYAEAADFWLVANLPREAYASATAGLKLNEKHTALRIARARSYALLGHYDYAETDLTSALVYDPKNAAALRYRADARRNLGKLEDAKIDIEMSLELDFTSVETALVRGEILEAIRLSK